VLESAASPAKDFSIKPKAIHQILDCRHRICFAKLMAVFFDDAMRLHEASQERAAGQTEATQFLFSMNVFSWSGIWSTTAQCAGRPWLCRKSLSEKLINLQPKKRVP
jgi:hypothetical protein